MPSIFATVMWVTLFASTLLPVSVLTSWVNGLVTSHSTIFSFALSCGVILLAIACGVKMPRMPSPSIWGWCSILLLVGLSYRVFLWGLTRVSGEYRCLLSNNLGDSCLHLSLVNTISSGGAFWPPSPWFSSDRLSYPLGPDMLDAMMVNVGMDPLGCIALTSLLLAVATSLLLWCWGGSMAVVVFSLGGSLFPLAGLLGVDPQYSENWKNLFLNVFSSQRGMQMAVPAGILMLILCRAFSKVDSQGQFSTSAFLLAVMPFASVHSTLALAPVLVMSAFSGNLKKTAPVAMLSLIVAGLSCWVIGALGKSSFVRLDSFFPGSEALNLVSWLMNYGLWLPLIMWVAYASLSELRKKISSNGLTLSLGEKGTPSWDLAVFLYFVILFFVVSFVAFSPWTWDNTKMLLWSVIGTSCYVWRVFLRNVTMPWRAVILLLLVGPSVPSVAREISVQNKGHRLFSAEEYHDALAAKKSIRGITRLAASPEYNHPWFVAGHPFLMGYGGWVWSHGIDYKDTRKKLGKVMSASRDWESLASELGITHLLWGSRERAAVKKDRHPVQETWKRVWVGPAGELYERN